MFQLSDTIRAIVITEHPTQFGPTLLFLDLAHPNGAGNPSPIFTVPLHYPEALYQLAERLVAIADQLHLQADNKAAPTQ
jgi:hypothetical protein